MRNFATEFIFIHRLHDFFEMDSVVAPREGYPGCFTCTLIL
jgi:hypothetical protein